MSFQRGEIVLADSPFSDRSGSTGVERSWSRVRKGLGCLRVMIWVEMYLGLLFALVRNWPAPLLLGCSLVLGGVVLLVGLALSLLAPARVGLRPHAIIAGVGFLASPVAFALPFVLIALTENKFLLQKFVWMFLLMLLASGVLMMAALVCYGIYLRGLARYLAAEKLARYFLGVGIALAIVSSLVIGGWVASEMLYFFHHRNLAKRGVMVLGFAELILMGWLGVLLARLHKRLPINE